ncbi:MAG TPA: hypothetical protein VK754_09825 [Propionibacteriaceae bacterium]|nr:hypothetical protein [Propionibacteriaceae bacterium]
MSTRALAASGEQIVSTDTYVSSALNATVQAHLPKINDGTGGTVAVDAEIRVESTGPGSIELLTSLGRRVGHVGPRSQAVVIARTGQVQADPDAWNIENRPQTPVAVVAAAGGTYTAAEQGLINAMRTCLIDNGLMKAE